MSDDTTPKKKEPTAQEAMFFFAIIKYTRNKPDVNWKAVAEEQGLKNAEVAKVRFGQIKRKLGISSDPGTVVATPPMTFRTSTKKTAPLAGTPTKVAKTAGRVGRKGRAQEHGVKKEEDGETVKEEEGQGDDEETLVGVKDEDEDEDSEDAALHAEVQDFLEDFYDF
ncbi:hypothetical protein E4U42_003701 [Claviceps africana]|uniref:Myb-like DNA-binding domain-containing protein n=1 Tax=Claviceps africana TaxID=83212 RepID=A0A8K0J8T1_9HYPO|nr:hypothetical protein E4U42_003701 [Claviceps africana]